MSEHTQTTGEKASLLSNILAIIGLIILVIIIVWGLVHLAELSSGWFSSLFEKSGPTINVTAPSDVTSGAPVSVSWDYTTTAAGSYAFLYQCQDGVQFALIDPSKNTASGIPCGASFDVTPASNSIQILPLIAGTTSKSVPFSILFVPTTGTQIEGTATMTIHPGSQPATTQTTQPAQTTTTTTSKPATTYTAPRTYSPADLSVHVISADIDQYGNAVVSFSVSNVGGTRSGAYSFSAQLPTRIPTPYASSAQAPLAPGGYIVDTLRFSQAVSGTFEVALNAGDADQADNYASRFMPAPAYYPSAGYNNNYNSYNQYPTYNQYTGPTGNYTNYQNYPYTY